jgi:diguanylate cyclase (GGDEF)-like protein
VCYLDLDGFKPVNDRFGHDLGDALLVALAKRLTETLREGDTLARLGGDELVVLLTALEDARQGEHVVQRLLDLIALPFEIGGHSIRVTGSFGITLYPVDHTVADGLLRHADQAMYQAKASSRVHYRFYDTAPGLQ